MSVFPYTPYVNRAVEYPYRRTLTATGGANEYDIIRSEGAVYNEGTLVSEDNVNASLEEIKAEFEKLGNIVTGTLLTGQTEITISDSRITTTQPLLYFTDDVVGSTNPFGILPVSAVKSTGQVVLTFEAQSFDMLVGVKFGGYV